MKILISALFLVLAAAVWAGDFEDGYAALNKGDYKTAFSLFKKVAEQGDPHAQTNSGMMYKRGEGVLQDYAEAVRWYKLAVEQGVSQAQLNLGFMYDVGKGDRRQFRARVNA